MALIFEIYLKKAENFSFSTFIKLKASYALLHTHQYKHGKEGGRVEACSPVVEDDLKETWWVVEKNKN